ncbi:hypothetical protein [Chryseobacterium oryzae]|uniref:Uncharacterized protein n=1 Tax=Chryseobacterium oryzae TaxID=2929799 RepID=A0ABY4BDQ2_9FLAO|nr:hypothetical protein [Chryseobacterium oryzae]UOE37014.1 hypothetical protein MTP08_08010 [Chryseobacterium oryzae]
MTESNQIQEILNQIEEELFSLNIDVEIKSNTIEWKDNFGAENYIDINYCAKYLENLAWWKFNDSGKDLVMFTKNNFIISWDPTPLNNMGQSFGCIYLKFCREILVIAYQDKSTQRVFSINTNNLDIRQLYCCNKIGVAIWRDSLFIKDYDRNECFSVNLHMPLIEKTFHKEESLKSNQIYLSTSNGIERFQNLDL